MYQRSAADGAVVMADCFGDDLGMDNDGRNGQIPHSCSMPFAGTGLASANGVGETCVGIQNLCFARASQPTDQVASGGPTPDSVCQLVA